MATSEAIARIADVLRQAHRVLCITGAGLSAEVGIPTYRGPSGLYREDQSDDALPVEEVLSGSMFGADPDRTWRALLGIEKHLRGKKPGLSHRWLQALESRIPDCLTVTQNVDGLQRRAGQKKLIELHGEMHELLCPRCEYARIVVDYADLTVSPRCPRCAAVLRPAVVFFGESLDPARVAQFSAELARGFEVVFSIGTSSVFDYVADPVRVAREDGALTVEINPERTWLSDDVDFQLPLPAGVALAQLGAAAFGLCEADLLSSP